MLFQDIHFTLNKQEKIALIGQNGVGKSTLLQIIAGLLPLSSGTLFLEEKPYYVPQQFAAYSGQTVAQVLGIADMREALQRILAAEVAPELYDQLNDRWDIEEASLEALAEWDLRLTDLDQPFDLLSGGEKVKVFLAGIRIHQPALLLLDEPSNHLDRPAREKLMTLLENTRASLLLVSHDRELLDRIPLTAEMSSQGMQRFGGNYSFYAAQKDLERNALEQQVLAKEKELRKAKDKEREANERQQKLNARGKGKQEKAGVARIMMNTLRNQAEGSSAKLKAVHQEKITGVRQDLQQLRASRSDLEQMKVGFAQSNTHQGKKLLEATALNYRYGDRPLWEEGLSFALYHGDRMAIQGRNGAGKTTLIQLILGKIPPSMGELKANPFQAIYVDQDYSLMQSNQSVYEMAASFNQSALQEHELKIRLNRFLFAKESWDQSCLSLSGGEKMRLLLCCLHIASQAPDLIILDEPTNNLDIPNMEILTAALLGFQGTLLVVSHDARFLEEIGVNRTLFIK